MYAIMPPQKNAHNIAMLLMHAVTMPMPCPTMQMDEGSEQNTKHAK